MLTAVEVAPGFADYDPWSCCGETAHVVATGNVPDVFICSAEIPAGRQAFALTWDLGSSGIVRAAVTAADDQIASVRCRVSAGIAETCRAEGLAWVQEGGAYNSGLGVHGEIDVPTTAVVSITLAMTGVETNMYGGSLYWRGGAFYASNWDCLNSTYCGEP